MNVKCGEGAEDKDERWMFICHHCGMPVCDEHGWVVSSDDAFDLSSQPRAGVPSMPPAAMHCSGCVDEHKGLDKHHGWVNPKALAVPSPGQAPAGQQQARAVGR